MKVSILVILEIQSDRNDDLNNPRNWMLFQSLLSWKYNQIMTPIVYLLNFFAWSFNPCYLGNTIRSSIGRRLSWKYNQISTFVLILSLNSEFQSLLSWKYNQINGQINLWGSDFKFQSLLSWKYNQIRYYLFPHDWTLEVSILVILEIQSDLLAPAVYSCLF